MHIYSWISTRTHCFDNNLSVSLIYHSKNHIYYFLKGTSSILWNLIVKYQSFDKVLLFARNNNIEKELNSLMFELKEKEIINTNKKFIKSDFVYLSKAISIKSPNFNHFYSKWMQYVYSHGSINTLFLELNYSCNLKCKHCYNYKDMNDYYISFDWAKKAIDQAYNLGISLVRITGGECTLNKDFLEIVRYARSKFLEVQINTNGQILHDNERLMHKLISLYPSEIRVSLYSMNPDIHDYITGIKGSWEKTINIIKKLQALNVNMIIATPVLSYNKDCYKDVLEFAASLGIETSNNCIFINNPKNDNLSSKLDSEGIEKFFIYKLTETKSKIRSNFTRSDMPICEAGRERLCITPKLDITPCVAVYYILGNLKSLTLEEIKNTTLSEFRDIFVRKNLKECFNESYCKYCVYCSDSACFNDTFMKKQPILCENAKAYYNAVLYCKKKGQNYENSSKI